MSLALDITGSGPPLVLLHPLGCDRRVWDPVVPGLADHRTVIAVDLPGFGESPPLAGVTPTPRALAEAVGARLAATGLERAHVAGNSLGGWVGLELALAGTAASVTAIAPAGLWRGPLLPKASLAHRLAHQLRPLAQAAVRAQAGRRVLLAGSVAHPERVPPADAVRLIDAYACASGFVAVNNAMRAGHFTALAELTVPVMLAWPDRDRLIERPAAIPPAVRNRVLHDAGHIPMWDAPDQVIDALLDGSGSGAAVGAEGHSSPIKR